MDYIRTVAVGFTATAGVEVIVICRSADDLYIFVVSMRCVETFGRQAVVLDEILGTQQQPGHLLPVILHDTLVDLDLVFIGDGVIMGLKVRVQADNLAGRIPGAPDSKIGSTEPELSVTVR